ncbi:E3 ubiquitin-protein ligase RING1-like [Olea europaea var. sylvestris]|uniref:E3 ubiquitin-protein ligase RING1-like n=1 Tax=Olea europaea var. sylvestris TaxID=158386 RepID=UPI000C1D050A|nr:E3 ubiquitin-protein ligase RING1-like [Olea europaea var. sylvestris]
MGFPHRKFLSEDKDKVPTADKGYDDHHKCKNGFVLPTPSLVPPRSNHQMPPILILMLCILAAAFVFLVFFTVRRYRWNLRNSRRRNSQTVENANNREDFIDENQGPMVDHPIWYIRTVGLQQSVIDSIAVFKYEKGQGLIEGTDCSVCLNEFQEDENLWLLPKCSHAFHVPCIDTWLRSHQNCPVCRAPIVSNTNSAPVSSVLTNSNDLAPREEARMESEVDQRAMETDETREMRVGIENGSSTQIEDGKVADFLQKNSIRLNLRNSKQRVVSDLVDNRMKLDEELQPVRRSISMDFSSASMIYNAVVDIQAKKDEGCSDSRLAIVEKQNSDMNAKTRSKNSSIYRLIKSASSGRSLQKGPISMKRSSSYVAKHSLGKYSASQDSIQTQP